MSRRELHVALEAIVRPWIRAACSWDSLAIGDYRFVIFSMEVAPETGVYVQFWSEPMEPVVWEVSSGKWNPPADEWLAATRAPDRDTRLRDRRQRGELSSHRRYRQPRRCRGGCEGRRQDLL